MKYNADIVVKWFKEHGITAVPEYRFCPDRKWRFDFVLMDEKVTDKIIALEVEGGVWMGGRHTRGSGFLKDMEKYNKAVLLGWRVLRTTPSDLCTMDTVAMVKEALNA